MEIQPSNHPQPTISPPQFHLLNKEQAYECSTLMLETNRDTFPFLVHGTMTEQYFLQQNRQLIDQCFETQQIYHQKTKRNTKFCYGLKSEGKVIAIILAIELKEYYRSIQHLIGVNQFRTQFKYLKIEEISIGTAVYYTRLSVKSQLKGRGLGKRLLYEASNYLKNQGFQYSIMGSIAKPSFQMFTKLGCTIQRHEQAVKPTFTYQIYIFKAIFQQLLLKISPQPQPLPPP